MKAGQPANGYHRHNRDLGLPSLGALVGHQEGVSEDIQMIFIGLLEWIAILAVTYGLSGDWVNTFMIWLAEELS